MRTFIAWAIISFSVIALPAKGGDIWLHMLSSGTPFAGTYYVGDSVGNGSDWWLQFEVGWISWYQSDAGIGPDTTDNGDWTWSTAYYYQDGFGNDRRIQGNIGSFRFSSAGNWYVNARVKEESFDPFHYANNTSWDHSTSFNPQYYFTVNALNNPGGQSASAISGSQINLSWNADAQGHWVMIVRSTDATFTAPNPGTSYNVNDTIGGDTVIYKGGGTSTSDTGLIGGTTYYYKFYSENWSYYSAGVTANATTTRPTDSIWDGGGANNNFKTDANWNNDVYPDQSISTKLSFAGTTRLSPNNDWAAGSTFNEIFFDSGAGAFTIGGNAFNIRTKIVNNDDSLQTINNDLTFPAQEVELKAESGAMTLGGTIANGGFRLTSSGANTLTLNGAISGAGDLLMYGSGTLVLNGANTFNPGAAAAYLVNGTTSVRNNSGLGVGTVNIGETFGTNPTTVQIGTAGVSVGNNLVVRSGSSGTMTLGNSSAGSGTFSGGVTLENSVTLANNSGTLTLSGAMSFNGSQKFINLNSGNSALISGAIGTDGSGGLVKVGDGTLQLSGVNTFAGLYIDRGIVDLTGGSLASGSTIEIGNTGGNGAFASSLKISANTFTLSRNIVVQSAAGTRTLETANSANTLTFSGGVTLNKDLTANIANGSAGVDAEFAGVVSGSGGLTKSGSGTLALSAANTYSGDTTISAGSLRLLSSNDRIGDNSLVNVSGSATFDMNDFFDKVKGLTGSGNVTLGSVAADRLRLGGDNVDRTFSGVISGAGNVIKEGSGMWTLSGVNTYTGDTKVESGTLRLAANDRLSDDTLVDVSSGATFDMNEFYDKIKGLTGSGSVTIGTGGGDRLRVGGDNADRTFSGVISEAGNVVKEGSGIWTLSGANTYIGDTKIEAGTIRLGANDRISDNSLINVSSGATFDMDSRYDKVKGLVGAGSVVLGAGTGDRLRVGGDNASRSFSGAISGGGNVIKEGTGSWTLSGTCTFNGDTSVSAGTLVVSGSSANSAHTVSSGAYLYGSGTVGAIIISGQASAGTASNTVGNFAASSVHLENNGRLQVNISAMTGSAGTDWDVLTVGGGSGTYTVNAVDGSDFVIALKGNPAFDYTQSYSIIILNAGTASGFAAAKFTINTAEFIPYLGGGTFSVNNTSGDLRLVFTPASIPSTPIANAASSIDHLTFTANWDAADGAESYRLDVAYDSGFTSMVSGYNDLTVNGTSQSVTVPYVGIYYYRVRAVNVVGTGSDSSTITVGTKQAQGRNKDGGSPYFTPSTIYLGDTVNFGVDTWGTLNGNYSKWRVVIDTDSNLRTGGVYGNWTADFSNSEYKENTSTRFTSVGTWYWGMQIDYGSPYGTNFWMVRDSSAWADLYYAGTNANLTVTVTALSDPTGISAVKDGTLSQSQINLAWTKWNSRDVMVVRSTGSIGTPAPGVAYTAGQSIPGGGTVVYIGGGTSFADTGLSSSTTYNYKYYSENFGYYSAGASATETTDGPVPDVPTAQAATLITTTSFQANWDASSGATSYRLDVSTVNNFSSFVSGYNNLTVNGTVRSVSSLTAGQTYYYRVRAANASGSSANSSTINVTLPASATVNIVDIPAASPTSGELTWSATVGAYYDVYYSDSDPNGSMTWTLVQQVLADNSMESLAVTEDDTRFYKVVIAGASASASSSPTWGVIKPTIPTGYSMMAAPLDLTDLSLNGEYGTALAEVLTGDNGGNADMLMIRESNGSWTTIFLDGSQQWSANYTLAEGQGYYIYRSGSPVQPRFAGPVGNNGVGSRTISAGWNIIGPSQGKTRTFAQVTSALAGTPAGGWEESTADLIVIDEGNGNFRRIMKYNGSPSWLDLKTFAAPTVSIQPGQGIYYMKQGSSGVTAINF